MKFDEEMSLWRKPPQCPAVTNNVTPMTSPPPSCGLGGEEDRPRVVRGKSDTSNTSSSEDEPFIKETHLNQEIILNASFDPVFAINEKGIINTVNDAAVKKFGYSKNEFLGSNISMICGGIHGQRHDSYLRRYLETNETKIMGKKRELMARCKDGSEFPVELGITEVFVGKKKKRYFIGFIRDLTEHKKVMEMEIERARADALLENMLPERVASRLKHRPKSGYIADHYPKVAILFADIVGFTSLTSNMTPVELVSMLNELFCIFDDLVNHYDLNKVKTIGDCYMVTSHPDLEDQEHECGVICNFGLDMIKSVENYNHSHPNRNLNLRVGINFGPVVAGIVGTKRFLYDIWGDAVNLASRMESTGQPGRIQVTKEVADVISNEFRIESRGLVSIKGKGDIETFFLLGKTTDKAPRLPCYRRMSSSMIGSMTQVSLVETLVQLKDTQAFIDSKITKIESQLHQKSNEADVNEEKR